MTCCILREPQLVDDEYTAPTKHGKTSLYKKGTRQVVTPVETPKYMIDLELGLKSNSFTVYQPKVMPGGLWTHGSRLVI